MFKPLDPNVAISSVRRLSMRRLFKVGADRHDVGRVVFAWHPEGNFLASAGKNGTVQITDRHGDIVDEIPMQTSAPILTLAWDKDGDYLAILQSGNGVVPLWSLSSRRVVPLETNLREPTFLAWSKTGPQLAVGTAKGNLLIYHKTKKQKIPIVGKHAKKISCGSWSAAGNRLVLGSEDRTLTVSNESGDTLLHTELKHVPLETSFTHHTGVSSSSSSSSGSNGGTSPGDDNMVSANLNGKSLYLFNVLDEKEDPMELTFAPKENGSGCKYGDIVHHEWFDDNHLLIGFSLGHLQVVSTNAREMGEEKFAAKFHPVNMLTFAYNSALKRAATTGDDGVRIVDTKDFKEIKADYISGEDLEDGRVTDLCWSPDGQILTVGTSAGNVYNFLAKMSVLNACYKTTAAYLSSLREVSVVDAVKRTRPIDVTLRLEPALIALGAKHVAAGMNNRVYYHRITRDKGETATVSDQEYVGTVVEVRLNATFAVVLTDSKATLHPIEAGPNSAKQTMTFPMREEGGYSKITCTAMTEDFLFYGTEAGTVESFYIAEFCMLPGLELRLDNPIKALYPNSVGTRVVVVDATGACFLYNPVTGGGVNQSITRFEDAPSSVVSVMWDASDKNVIVLYDGKFIHTYVYAPASMKGPLLTKLGPVVVSKEGQIELSPDKIEVVPGNIPIICIGGIMTCQTVSGSLTTMVHPYFDQLTDSAVAASSPGKGGKGSLDDRRDVKAVISRFCQALALLKLEMAWQAALELDRRQFWLALSGKAMELLNVELACRVYRQLGDAGMVMALQECQHVEDKNQLAGIISLLFCDYQRAQELFLASSRPGLALEMRRDLLQWDQALKLAQTLDTSQVPEICVQYGQQLEFRGEVDPALKMFDAALNAQDSRGRSCCPDALVPVAMMGVARCNLRGGNIRQGLRLCQELDDATLYSEAGDILEQNKQYAEAASCFIKAQQFERAAFIYTKFLIRADKGRIAEAVTVMEKVSNDQLNSAFAKACVAAGRFPEACAAYERAKDLDKVVELKLRHLDQVQAAFDLVRQGGSSVGASLVADYCQEGQDFRGAIEFLLLAGRSEDSFRLAQTHGLVDVYTAQLGDTIGAEEALQVAVFYEKAQDMGRAGRCVDHSLFSLPFCLSDANTQTPTPTPTAGTSPCAASSPRPSSSSCSAGTARSTRPSTSWASRRTKPSRTSSSISWWARRTACPRTPATSTASTWRSRSTRTRPRRLSSSRARSRTWETTPWPTAWCTRPFARSKTRASKCRCSCGSTLCCCSPTCASRGWSRAETTWAQRKCCSASRKTLASFPFTRSISSPPPSSSVPVRGSRRRPTSMPWCSCGPSTARTSTQSSRRKSRPLCAGAARTRRSRRRNSPPVPSPGSSSP